MKSEVKTIEQTDKKLVLHLTNSLWFIRLLLIGQIVGSALGLFYGLKIASEVEKDIRKNCEQGMIVKQDHCNSPERKRQEIVRSVWLAFFVTFPLFEIPCIIISCYINNANCDFDKNLKKITIIQKNIWRTKQESYLIYDLLTIEVKYKEQSILSFIIFTLKSGKKIKLLFLDREKENKIKAVQQMKDFLNLD